MSNLLKRGFGEAEKVEKEKEKRRENRGKQLWRFFLSKNGDEADVRFLTEEPINFYEHTIPVTVNGKPRYDNVPCTGEDCSLCAKGDRPAYKGAFLIYDKRKYSYKDKTGASQEVDGTLRLYIQGSRVITQLKRLSERYGLTTRDYTVVRNGEGTATTYSFDRSDEVSKLTEKDIKGMLPDNLKDKYNGTEDSLLDIVEEQIELMGDYYEEKKDSSEEKDDSEDSATKNLVGVEDTPKKKHTFLKKKVVVEDEKKTTAKSIFKKK